MALMPKPLFLSRIAWGCGAKHVTYGQFVSPIRWRNYSAHRGSGWATELAPPYHKQDDRTCLRGSSRALATPQARVSAAGSYSVFEAYDRSPR